jgi:putative endonuclease
VAVELKARAALDTAAHAIDRRQQARIARALDHFLAANPAYAEFRIRFDAVLVAPGKLPRHIPDAWRIE